MVDGRLKEAAEVADREKALKDVAEATAREKEIAAASSERKAIDAEMARRSAEDRLTISETKLGETELKLATADSMVLAQAAQIGDLQRSLEASENEWYDRGFADAENSAEPIIYQARRHGFAEGWMAALKAVGLAEDSPLWDPAQVPYPAIPQSAHDQVESSGEDTPSMIDLVRDIDAHAETADQEAASDNQSENAAAQSPRDRSTSPAPSPNPETQAE